MARSVNTNAKTLLINISPEQKEKLVEISQCFGSNSLSSFICAIADGKYKIVSDDAYTLLEAIREKRAARKERYEAKKQKEDGQP